MTMTDAQLRADAKYKKDKVHTVAVHLYPADRTLEEFIRSHGNSTYLKDLARKEMQAGRDWELVRSGKSSIFEEWKALGRISVAEFMAGVEWILADSKEKDGEWSRRAIGLVISPDMNEKLVEEWYRKEQERCRKHSNEKIPDVYPHSEHDPAALCGHIERLHRQTDPITGLGAYYRDSDGMIFGPCSWAHHAIIDRSDVWDLR